jgi:oligopeptide transport system substrate-binding protein
MARSLASDSGIKHAKPGAVVATIVTAVLILLLAACDFPFSDDADDESTATPTEAQVPDRPDSSDDQSEDSTPEATIEQRDDGWTIVTGPDRRAAPSDRSSDQVFTIAGSSEPPSTGDPALVRDTESAFLARQVFRGLIKLDAELEPVPDLARQVEISSDGRTYRFRLFDDLSFHDGSPITAQSVKDSLERAANPALTGGDGDLLPSRNYLDDIVGARDRMDGLRDDIPGIRVLDQLSLEIELERGVVDFLERLSNPTTYIVDVSQAELDGDWWLAANGSGPFRLVEWDPQRQITLQPHDGYVQPPLVSEVRMRVGPEAVGQMQLYETGQIDIVTVPLSVLDRVEYAGSPIDGNLRAESLLSTSFVLFNQQHSPVDQSVVREAIIRTFPRTQLVDVMLDGRVRLAEGILPPEMDSVTEMAFPYPHDPELARSLAGQAIAGSFDNQLTIHSSGGAIPVAMKYFIEQELSVSVEVVQLRWPDYMSDMEDGRLPIFVLSWVADGPDPVSFLRALFHSESPDNYARYSDQVVDDLLDRASVEQDEAERSEMLQEAHRLILESGIVMPLYHTVDYVLVGSHVRGLETTPMGILGLEDVWIDR